MIISMVNQKGGVAKTTSTLNIGALLAEQGKKVLMIDLDPQSSLTISLGIEEEQFEYSMYDVMCEGIEIDKVILQVKENLFIAPAIIDLSVAELQLVNEMARESLLKKRIAKIKDDYDYIVIDCPPSLGLLVVNALNVTDKVIIPCTTSYLSYRGLKLLLNTVEKVKNNLNFELEVMGVIATMYDKRTTHAREVLELLEEKHKVLGKIGTSIQAQDCILEGKALVDYNSKHPIVQAYREVVEVIINE